LDHHPALGDHILNEWLREIYRPRQGSRLNESASLGPYTAAQTTHGKERERAGLPILSWAAGRGPRPASGGRALWVPPLVRLRRGASRLSYWWTALPRTPFGRVLVLLHDAPPPAALGSPGLVFSVQSRPAWRLCAIARNLLSRPPAYSQCSAAAPPGPSGQVTTPLASLLCNPAPWTARATGRTLAIQAWSSRTGKPGRSS
jgi:hypothetical protein